MKGEAHIWVEVDQSGKLQSHKVLKSGGEKIDQPLLEEWNHFIASHTNQIWTPDGQNFSGGLYFKYYAGKCKD